jgi:aldehyde oxidoreductase
VELEELPAYMSAPAALADDAIEIHPGTPNAYCEIRIVKGAETGPILEQAACMVEDDFYTQRQPHLPIEPDMGLAYFDEEGRLTIQSKSIGLYVHAMQIFGGLGIDLEKLRLIQNPTGGTFGYKASPTLEALLGVACMATGRPVYLEYDYEQFIGYTGKRSPFWTHLKFGADRDGKLLAMESEWMVDHGPYSEFGDMLTMKGAQYIGAGYHIPSIRGRGRTICTNHAWGSAMRGWGSPESEFSSESLMDELAAKLGIDPLELRYRNVYRPGSTTPTGQTPEVFSLDCMIDRLRPKYQAAKERTARESTPEIQKGVGVALGIFGAGTDGADMAEVWIELTASGVTAYTTWEDHGQGADAGAVGTVHEALLPLKLHPSQIRLVLNDTARVPNGGVAAGSRSQVIIGNAIKNGCDQLLEAMQKPDGSYRTYAEMVAEGIPLRYTGMHFQNAENIEPDTSQGSPIANYMYAIFMAEVAVDTRTGKVAVEKMTCVADPGKVNNRAVVDGQIYGGMSQGIGMALSEDYEDIHKHNNMVRCGLPFAKDVPDDMEILYEETPRPEGPFGASGVGELPSTGSHTCIINAIYWATGARITHLPARPEVVLEKLRGIL